MDAIIDVPQTTITTGMGDVQDWLALESLTDSPNYGKPRSANHCPLARMFYMLYDASEVMVDADYISVIGPAPQFDWLYHERNEGEFGAFIRLIDECAGKLTYEYICDAANKAAAEHLLD